MAETMLIRGKGGDPVRINKSAFKEGKHTEYTGKDADDKQNEPGPGAIDPSIPVPPAPSAPTSVNGGNPVAPTVPSENQRMVKKEGKKFFVVNPDGSPVEHDLIDKKGYDTDALAWEAIMKLPR